MTSLKTVTDAQTDKTNHRKVPSGMVTDRPWRRPGRARYAITRLRGFRKPPVTVHEASDVVVDNNQPVLTRDGTELRVNVYRPQSRSKGPTDLAGDRVTTGWQRVSMRALDESATLPGRPAHTYDQPEPLTVPVITGKVSATGIGSSEYSLDVRIWRPPLPASTQAGSGSAG